MSAAARAREKNVFVNFDFISSDELVERESGKVTVVESTCGDANETETKVWNHEEW